MIEKKVKILSKLASDRFHHAQIVIGYYGQIGEFAVMVHGMNHVQGPDLELLLSDLLEKIQEQNEIA
ncbi:MAG: hypothetical protein KJO86_00225 [Muriicola sp.]|nr:hypothetical protein [Muriicola sp.]